MPPAAAQGGAGQLSVRPDRLSFKSAVDRCQSRKVEAENRTGAAVNNLRYDIDGPDSFAVAAGFKNCPKVLSQGETCRIYVKFCPFDPGVESATLVFAADGGGGAAVPIEGRAHRQSGR